MGLFDRKKKQRGEQEQFCTAVVAAAGSARRMEGCDKILALVGDYPLLYYSLRELELSQMIQEILVVTREDLLVPVSQLCREYGFEKVRKVVVGGEERMNSVLNGLREADPRADLIAIQDGARPFLTQRIISDTVLLARQFGAAAPAVPVKDTIKRAPEEIVTETFSRSELRAVQTPQVFEASLIKAALQKALDDGAALTDDCAAVERIGVPVHLSQGDETNIKVTTPFDLRVAEAILEGRDRI